MNEKTRVAAIPSTIPATDPTVSSRNALPRELQIKILRFDTVIRNIGVAKGMLNTASDCNCASRNCESFEPKPSRETAYEATYLQIELSSAC
jgi:hypothetical protein